MASHKQTKVYKLSGASFRAAKDVYDAMHSPTQTLGGEDFVHEYRGELKILGLMSKAVQVVLQDGALPRAYVHVPACYVGPSDNFYMVAPVDYKGRSFVPEGGILLDDGAIAKTGIWQGGWGDHIEPLTPRRYAAFGVQMPADFDKGIHDYKRVSAQFNKTYHFFKGLERIKQHFCDGIFVAGLGEDEVLFDYDLTCDENRRPVLMMAAHRNDNKQAVTLRSNGWLNVEKSHGDFYIVRPNIKTAGGMVLQDSLNRVPEMASLQRLWQEQNDNDGELWIMPPPSPAELIHQQPGAPWPFPKSAPAP